MIKPFYITTAIDYANGKPHIGHAYEKILADTIVRFKKSCGMECFFLTGLDEHGQKVEQTALSLGVTPQENCDNVAVYFKKLLVDLNIANDKFIRTTDKSHTDFVAKILIELYNKDLIYKSSHKGFFSVRQEQFVTEKDRNKNGTWPEIFGEVQEIEEENYFFRLSKYNERLKQHFRNNPNWIYPESKRNSIYDYLQTPLQDLCISRPKSRVSWGIELPFDDKFVTYVWFDALLNYVSAVVDENVWPPNAQVIGKDILAPAHAIYWPCILFSLDIELPEKLIVHGWWTINGEKASKSTGIGNNFTDYTEKYSVDAFRYYLLKEMALGNDADFSETRFNELYNSDLKNGLGNLINRTLSLLHKSDSKGVVPQSIKDHEVNPLLKDHPGTEFYKEVTARYYFAKNHIRANGHAYQFDNYIRALWLFVNDLNKYIDVTKPWILLKSEWQHDEDELCFILSNLIDGIRVIGLHLKPIMPETSDKILTMLDCHQNDTHLRNLAAGKKLPESYILFPKVD